MQGDCWLQQSQECRTAWWPAEEGFGRSTEEWVLFNYMAPKNKCVSQKIICISMGVGPFNVRGQVFFPDALNLSGTRIEPFWDTYIACQETP